MVIGIDASRAFVKDRTGTENYSFQLIKHLSQIDTENIYLIYLRPHTVIPDLIRNPGEHNTGSQITRPSCGGKSGMTKNKWPSNFKFKVINFPRFWTQIGLAWQTFIDPLDLLFVPGHTLPLIRKSSLKTVITVHDLGAEYLPGLHQLKQLLYLKLVTHYQLKTASKIIAVSKATKMDIMKKIGIPGGKIEVVYEGVDKSLFKPISKDIVNDIMKKYDLVSKDAESADISNESTHNSTVGVSSLGRTTSEFGKPATLQSGFYRDKNKPIGERGKYFLFVGTIQPRKNLERLIKAFQIFLKEINDKQSLRSNDLERLKIKDSNKGTNSLIINHKSLIKLILVGQKGWKSDDIYNLPKELGIEDKVKFLGRIPDEELPALYAGALALTYPSLFEGFGLPILESFGTGTPVITSNVSSMPEVAGDAALLVDPYSEKDIAQAMLKVYENDTLKDNLVINGYRQLDKFSWHKAAEQTLEVFKNIGRSK